MTANTSIFHKLVTVSDQVSKMEYFLGTAQSSPTEIIIRLDIGIQRPLIIIQLGKDTQRIRTIIWGTAMSQVIGLSFRTDP